jgi:hypothetical protein
VFLLCFLLGRDCEDDSAGNMFGFMEFYEVLYDIIAGISASKHFRWPTTKTLRNSQCANGVPVLGFNGN